MTFLSKIFGDANERYIKSLEPIVEKINDLEKEFQGFNDEQLKAKTDEFKKRLSEGETLDDILPEAFAAVREASKRTLGQRHFDVQLMGGIVLHQGKIAEMRTGEGKTLVATLPAYLNALTGKGVHIVSVNDYLVRRDTAWMGQIYNALGITVGCINHEGSYLYDPAHQKKGDLLDKQEDTIGAFHVVHEFLRPVEKKEAYNADITYGTNNEYGFDYLRDNMAYSPEQMVQLRRSQSEVGAPTKASGLKNTEVQPRQIEVKPQVHNFAIVDEVDSILIDEARTPLIISAPDTESTELYKTFSRVVPRLAENDDYNVDEKLKAVSITEAGIEKVEKILNLSNIYDQGGVRYVHHLEQALKANILFKRDRDYVVKDGEVIIVDEFTGRLMPGRRWSEGLHQAVEAKEDVSVQKESRTLATITFQNYFRLYKKISGMTGTARTSAEELHKVYNVDVVSVPTNKPAIRQDLADRIYKTEIGKFKAVAKEVKERNEKGQPVLIGTVSIQKNELMSKLLEREGVEHRVLNAKQHEKEAELHAQAGRLGAVTVATNMAGRGVDIILGGNPQDPEEARMVCDLGGLHVIGTERHEARRIDDQLRGRAGRQGDPGSSQFFVSTEDDVIRIFGGDRLKNMMDTLGIGEEDVIENKFISRAIEQAQFRIEGHNFDIRKYVLEYDDVMNKHREAIYRLRKEVLFSKDMKETVLGYVLDVVNQIVTLHAPEDEMAEWNLEEIAESIKTLVGKNDSIHADLIEVAGIKDFHKLSEFIFDYVTKAYEAKEKETSPEMMRQLERLVLLRTIDELWMDHIEAMEHLRDSVRLRAYGQRDPLIEYKIEGQKMFENLQNSVKGQVANLIFKVSLMHQPREVKMEERRPEIEGGKLNVESGKKNSEPPSTHNAQHSNVGRNDPCPCGSGKKYKKCHGS
ncbi:MAG: preprotein translocase subunit SecA [Candidatus Taylorbacteria bacterium]|nr:preprotein translocase subunit SecA [Candidatus Taylorbacteria bacterium]